MRKNSISEPSEGPILLENSKLYNTAKEFPKRTEIIDDARLSKEEKTTALDTWEQDARQRMTASNEGMPGEQEGLQAEDHHRLGEVGLAKSETGATLKHKSAH